MIIYVLTLVVCGKEYQLNALKLVTEEAGH